MSIRPLAVRLIDGDKDTVIFSGTSQKCKLYNSNRDEDEKTVGEAIMLGCIDANATIAVKGIKLARRFYEGALGLEQVRAEETRGRLYMSGNSSVRIYESTYASTNKATPVSWTVGDEIDGVLEALKTF